MPSAHASSSTTRHRSAYDASFARTHDEAEAAADFNTAWGATEPAPLDDGRGPPAFQPQPVHGWSVTMPAPLDMPMVSAPFQEPLHGLAIREVHEPELFRHFFGPKPVIELALEPLR